MAVPVQSTGATPLYIASTKGNEAVARILLDNGAEVNKATVSSPPAFLPGAGGGASAPGRYLLAHGSPQTLRFRLHFSRTLGYPRCTLRVRMAT